MLGNVVMKIVRCDENTTALIVNNEEFLAIHAAVRTCFKFPVCSNVCHEMAQHVNNNPIGKSFVRVKIDPYSESDDLGRGHGYVRVWSALKELK